MKSLTVIQHTSAEYLGLMEDHLEGRRIRFRYYRPFTGDKKFPTFSDVGDGLVLLGGGPWGSAGTRDVPTLAEEIALARACFMEGKPIIGIGLGAQILAIAAEGGSDPAPLAFRVGRATRASADALNGFLPESFPHITYMRDKPRPPKFAKILATDDLGDPAIFQIGENMLGFTGHPGFKRAMAEDLIMEFEEGPEDPAAALDAILAGQQELEDALIKIMTGLIQLTELMRGEDN